MKRRFNKYVAILIFVLYGRYYLDGFYLEFVRAAVLGPFSAGGSSLVQKGLLPAARNTILAPIVYTVLQYCVLPMVYFGYG